MIVRLSEGRWMDLETMTRFELKEVELADGVMTTLAITPQIGAREVLTDGEALAVEDVLEQRSRPFPMLTVTPGLLDHEPPLDAPQEPTMGEVVAEVLEALRSVALAWREDAALNVVQRLRRFIFGGHR